MADKLDNLEKRLNELETRVFGEVNKDATYPKPKDLQGQEVIDSLAGMNTKISSSIAGRPKIQALLKRLGELEVVLDPGHMESVSLSHEAKIEIIVAEEDIIRQNFKNLEKVKDMTEALGSEHIKAVPALQSRLQEISTTHLSQQDAVTELAEDTKKTILSYNHLVTLLSKQFVQWEELFTALEQKASVTESM